MNTQDQHLDTLQDIKKMMERSSRFISLSGLSGIAAGTCALIGAWVTREVLRNAEFNLVSEDGQLIDKNSVRELINNRILSPRIKYSHLHEELFLIAAITLAAALVLSFLFTYLRSRKEKISIWGKASKRLMFNVSIPMIVGGLFVFKLLQRDAIGLIAPSCLIFYGLALVHASKYTLGEVRYLGYGQIILGIINLWFVGYGLYFWAAGFGVLHIVYGTIMWLKYERNAG
jgi:hypothetical protein